MPKKPSVNRQFLENLVKQSYKNRLIEQDTTGGFQMTRRQNQRQIKKSFPKAYTNKFSDEEVNEILLAILVGMPASRDQVSSFGKNKVKYGLSDYSSVAAALDKVKDLTPFEQVIFRFLKIVSLPKKGAPGQKVKMQWNKELFDKISSACKEGERLILREFEKTIKQDRTSILPFGLFPQGPKTKMDAMEFGSVKGQGERINNAFEKFLNKIYEIYDEYNIIDETGILATGFKSTDFSILTRKASEQTINNFYLKYGREIYRGRAKGASAQSGYRPVRKILEKEVLSLSEPFKKAKITNFLQLRRNLSTIFGDREDPAAKIKRSPGSRFRVYNAVAVKQSSELDNDPASLLKSFLDVGISLYTSVSLVGLLAKPVILTARLSPEIAKLFVKSATNEVSKVTLKQSMKNLFTTKVGLKRLADIIITIPFHFKISFDQMDREIGVRLQELRQLHAQFFKFLSYELPLTDEQKKFIEYCKGNPGKTYHTPTGKGGMSAQTCPTDPSDLSSYIQAPFSTSFSAVAGAAIAGVEKVSPTTIEDVVDDIKEAWTSIYNEMIKINLLLASVNEHSSAGESTVVDMQAYQKNIINDPKNKEGLNEFLGVIAKIYEDAKDFHKKKDTKGLENQYRIGSDRIVEVINFHNKIQEKSSIIEKQIIKMKKFATEIKEITTLDDMLQEDTEAKPQVDSQEPEKEGKNKTIVKSTDNQKALVQSVVSQLPKDQQLVNYGPLGVKIANKPYIVNFEGENFRLNEKVFTFVSKGFIDKEVSIESAVRQGSALVIILGALGMSTKIQLVDDNVVEMFSAALKLTNSGEEHHMNLKDADSGDIEEGKIVLKSIDNKYPKPKKPKETSPLSGNKDSIIIIGDSNSIHMAQLWYEKGKRAKSGPYTILQDGQDMVSPVIGSGQVDFIYEELQRFFNKKGNNYNPTTAIMHLGYNAPSKALTNIKKIVTFLNSKGVNDIRIVDVKASEPMPKPYIKSVKRLSRDLKTLPNVTIIKNEEKNDSSGFHFSEASYKKLLDDAKRGTTADRLSNYEFVQGTSLKYRVPDRITPAVAPSNWKDVGTETDWIKFRNFLGGIEGSGIYNIKGGDGNLYDGVYQFGFPEKAANAGETYGKTDPETRSMWRTRPQMQENAFTRYTKKTITFHAKRFKKIDDTFDLLKDFNEVGFILPDGGETVLDPSSAQGAVLMKALAQAIKQGLLSSSHNVGAGAAKKFFEANWVENGVVHTRDFEVNGVKKEGLPTISIKIGNGDHDWKTQSADGFGNRDVDHFIKVVKIKTQLTEVSSRPAKFTIGYDPSTNKDYQMVQREGKRLIGLNVSKKDLRTVADLTDTGSEKKVVTKKKTKARQTKATSASFLQDMAEVRLKKDKGGKIINFNNFVSVFGEKYFPKFDVFGKSLQLKKDREDIEKTDLSQFAEKKKEQLKNNYLARNKGQILNTLRKIKDEDKREQLLSLEGRVRLPVYFPSSFLRYSKTKGYTLFFELENLKGMQGGADVENGDITVVPSRNPGVFESIKFMGTKSERYIEQINIDLDQNIKLLKAFKARLDGFSQEQVEVEYLTMEDRKVYQEFINNLIEIFEIGKEALTDKDSGSTIRRAWKVVNLAAVIYLIP